MSHTYFSTSPYHRETYHITDMDKVAPHNFFIERDAREEMRKGGGDRAIVPVYKYETSAFPELSLIPRGADDRNRVLENRRQNGFRKSHSNLIMERPFG